MTPTRDCYRVGATFVVDYCVVLFLVCSGDRNRRAWFRVVWCFAFMVILKSHLSISWGELGVELRVWVQGLELFVWGF